MKNIFIALSFFSLIYSCKKQVASEDKIMEVNLEKVAFSEPVAASLSDDKTDASIKFENPNKPIDKKIIKNGEMTIQVGDINKSRNQVSKIIEENKAYIQRENFRNSDQADNLNLIIKVPHQNFEKLVNSFSDGMGSVVSKSISSDDVTEEYSDVSIKLANKKIYLEKYRDMLKSAKTTKDILEIQENIRELEDEIDISEGRLKFIDDHVQYSSLDLTIFKEKVRSSTTSKIGFGSRFGDSITEGWNSFVGFILGIISFWPFLLFVPVIVFLWKKWKVRKQAKKNNEKY